MKYISLLFALGLLCFSKNSMAEKLFFIFQGTEIPIVYSGNKSLPTAVTFTLPCNRSHCDSKAVTETTMRDFTQALASGSVYKYEISNDSPNCHIVT